MLLNNILALSRLNGQAKAAKTDSVFRLFAVLEASGSILGETSFCSLEMD